MRQISNVVTLSVWLLLGVIASVGANLSQVQQQIQKQQSKIAEQKKQRESLQSTLKSQELEIGQVASDLKKTELSLGEIKQLIANTEQEIKRLEKQEKRQKEKLKQQLDSAYRSGIHPSVLERLLSESAKDADRKGAYYEHINQARLDAILELRRTQDELKARRDELKGQQKGQQTQLSEQKKQEQALQKVKNEREKTISALDRTLNREEERLAELKANEVALSNQLANAENENEHQIRKKEQQEVAKLDQSKATEKEKQAVRDRVRKEESAGAGLGNNKYEMPVKGKIIGRFGQRYMGELSWHGIVIQAQAGTPVKAITSGKVVMANWFNSYGLTVVLDHGNGDTSVYAFNQSLAVRVGSKVSAGQVISYVGNSGGQSQPSLYFSIYRKGKPFNPTRWLK